MKYFVLLLVIGFSLLSIPQAFAIGQPPPERVPASSHGVYDLEGNRVELVEVGEQIQIIADISNSQEIEQPFVYMVSIADHTGEAIPYVHYGELAGTLAPMTAFSPAVSWIPEKPGHYKAEIAIAEPEDRQSRLSPDLETEFYVVGDMSAVKDNRSCGEKNLVFKIGYSKVGCVSSETLVKLLGRGWARWHDWYDPVFIENLRKGPQDLDSVHAEFVKRATMKDSKVADFLFRKAFDYSCCDYLYNKDDNPPKYQLLINFFDHENKTQLAAVYDLRQSKVVKTEISDLTKFGGPIIPEEKSEPSTRIEISFGKPMTRNFLPVVFSEITTNAESLDKITVWKFELIGHSGDDRGITWDIVPKDTGIFYEITDENGQDIIDHARMQENWAIPSDQPVYNMDCGGFQEVTGESARPSSFPIKNNIHTVIAKNSWMGIYPDSDGKYSFEFASIFETLVKLPEGAEIISQESKHCKLTQNIEGDPEGKYADGYYTKMVFRLE